MKSKAGFWTIVQTSDEDDRIFIPSCECTNHKNPKEAWKCANKAVTAYLSEIGRKGGQKSRRTLTPEQAREMVRAREAKKRK